MVDEWLLAFFGNVLMVSLEFRIWWSIILLKNVGYLVNSFRLTLKTRNMSEAKWRDPPPKKIRPNNSSHVLSNIEISHEILPTKYSKIPIFQYGYGSKPSCCLLFTYSWDLRMCTQKKSFWPHGNVKMAMSKSLKKLILPAN